MTDREKIIKVLCEGRTKAGAQGLNGVFFDFSFIDLLLEMLKEQDGIIPYIDIDEAKCPVCKVKLTRQELLGDDVLFEDFFDYCPHCGKPVLWEGK